MPQTALPSAHRPDRRPRATRRRLAAALLALAAPIAAPTGARAQEIVLRLHHYLPAQSFPQTRFLAPWAEKVERESGGRIRIAMHPAMQLGGTQAQLYDQVREGAVDLVWTMPGATPGRFPKTEVFEMPFVATDAVGTTMGLQDYAAKHLRDEFRDVHVLLLHANDGLVIHANRPIRRLEDYAGLRIRTPNRAGTAFLRAVGAVPVGAPVPEVPQMLSKGAIDGTLISHEIALPLRVHEMVRFHSDFAGPQPRVQAPVFLFAMNRARYEGLPPELRRVIDDNSGLRIAADAGRTWSEIERIGERAARERGNEFATMPAAEVERVRAVVRPAIDDALRELSTKGFDAKALHDEARSMVASRTTVRP